ncbi:unnamed protein product, partial [Ectocarpus sp. 12 AP-2014]
MRAHAAKCIKMAHRRSALDASRFALGGSGRLWPLQRLQRKSTNVRPRYPTSAFAATTRTSQGSVMSRSGCVEYPPRGRSHMWASAVSSGGVAFFPKCLQSSNTGYKTFSAAAGDTVEDIVSSVQGYYDDPNALNFHMQAWGEDIHIGRYDLLSTDELKMGPRERIKRATALSTRGLLGKVFPPSPGGETTMTVMDMGSAHGSTARMAAKEHGCNVVCIDISRGFNTVNAKLSAAAGLSDKIIIPGERSYFDTEMPAASMDAVLSQDAFGHASTEHHRAIKEAARVLKPGGVMAFSDFMQSDHADPTKLGEVYQHIGISRLASPGLYEEWGKAYGLELVEFDDRTSNFSVHYQHLVDVIASLRGTIKGVDDEFLDRMTSRYGSWCVAAEFDVLRWGVIVFKKSST